MPTPDESYDEIRRLKGEVRKARQDLELFARVLAHDLKEPLRTINAFTQLLAQHAGGNGEDGQIIEWAALTHDATAVIARLVDGLSRYSAALQTGGRPFSPTPTDAVLAIALRRLESATRKANAQITCQNLPVVAGDPDRLCDVFEHLVDNALKYSRSVPPVIEISALSHQEECTFTVEDNGLGIAPEYHERIFMPFKRLHGREIPGVGLGLPICKEIVEKHGGRIWLDSGASGSKFIFTLPPSGD